MRLEIGDSVYIQKGGRGHLGSAITQTGVDDHEPSRIQRRASRVWIPTGDARRSGERPRGSNRSLSWVVQRRVAPRPRRNQEDASRLSDWPTRGGAPGANLRGPVFSVRLPHPIGAVNRLWGLARWTSTAAAGIAAAAPSTAGAARGLHDVDDLVEDDGEQDDRADDDERPVRVEAPDARDAVRRRRSGPGTC